MRKTRAIIFFTTLSFVICLSRLSTGPALAVETATPEPKATIQPTSTPKPISAPQPEQVNSLSLDSRVSAAIVAGIFALLGSYLGTRWGFSRFKKEQRYEKRQRRRDILAEYLGETRGEIAEYIPKQQIDGEQIPPEVRRHLQTETVRLNAQYLDDPRVAKQCSVLLRVILSESTRNTKLITDARDALNNLEQILGSIDAEDNQTEN